MQNVNLNGADLEYTEQGTGEPLLLIHGSIFADGFAPLLSEPSIVNNYRVIMYHRRGFAGSSRAPSEFTIKQQSEDARALLRHLGIDKVHIAGHSYGAVIALQWALDAPHEVHSLALLETAPIFDNLPSAPEFWDGMAAIGGMYERGEKLLAVDAFSTGVAGPDYREVIDRGLPAGAFDLAVADIDTFFQVETGALEQWQFGAEDAERVTQPILVVVGSETAPLFRESHEQFKRLFPHAHELVVPGATHALQIMKPGAIADGLNGFLSEYRMQGTEAEKVTAS